MGRMTTANKKYFEKLLWTFFQILLKLSSKIFFYHYVFKFGKNDNVKILIIKFYFTGVTEGITVVNCWYGIMKKELEIADLYVKDIFNLEAFVRFSIDFN